MSAHRPSATGQQDPIFTTGQYDMNALDDSYVVPRRRPTGVVIAVAVLVSFGTVVGLNALTASWKRSCVVPVLVGLPEAQARTVAEGAGLTLAVSGSMRDPVVAKGAVAEQAPLAGVNVAAGTLVTVKLSTGLTDPASPLPVAQPLAPEPKPAPLPPPPAPNPAPVAKPAPVKPAPAPVVPGGPTVVVPKAVGVRLKFATSRLTSAGVTVGRVTYEADEDHIEGFVLRQTPAAGTPAPRGSTVDLVVNKLD